MRSINARWGMANRIACTKTDLLAVLGDRVAMYCIDCAFLQKTPRHMEDSKPVAPCLGTVLSQEGWVREAE
jgi:hypothetical protein